MTNQRRDPGPEGRKLGRFAELFHTDAFGFTLLEVLAAIVVLGLVGVAATNLVLRLTAPRQLTLRYEQESLAARAAAEQIWDAFAADEHGPPEACTPPLTGTPTLESPPADGLNFLNLAGIGDFQFAFRCAPYEDSDTLYRVWVWLRKTDSEEMIAMFDMLALQGGY